MGRLLAWDLWVFVFIGFGGFRVFFVVFGGFGCFGWGALCFGRFGFLLVGSFWMVPISMFLLISFDGVGGLFVVYTVGYGVALLIRRFEIWGCLGSKFVGGLV